MKRITVLLLVCLLFVACKAPGTPRVPETGTVAETAAPPHRTVRRSPGPDAAKSGGTQQSPEPIIPETQTLRTAEETIPLPEPEPSPTRPAMPLSLRFPGRFSETPELTERSYKSSTVDITVTTRTVRDTYARLASFHVADIYVKDVTSIRTAAARSFDTRYERTVKEMADDAGALLAIDGDTYTRSANSLVIRNGELYRDTPIEDTDICILYRDGRMETKKWGTFTAQEVIASDPWQVWGFGPALLDEDGHAVEIEHRLSPWNPRAAIGYYEPGHYCFVIVDGRDHDWSEGVKLSALSRLMEDLGCRAAYNLDGGDSAQMYWNGGIISKSRNQSRIISDIIYILPES